MSQEDSQSTQRLFPPQKRLAEIRENSLLEARKEFSDSLTLKNNNGDNDDGVNMGILALEDQNPMKALSKMKKEPLIATLGFLHDLGFNEAKERFKKPLVEELKKLIIEKYEILSPQQCEACKDIYNNGKDYESCLQCFCCLRNLCPTCVPKDVMYPGRLLPTCKICEKKFSH